MKNHLFLLALTSAFLQLPQAHALLVAHYPFEGDLTDASGNGNNLTGANGPGFGTGTIGQALSLNGSNQSASAPDSPSLRVGPYTVSAWINPATNDEYWSGVIGKPGRNFNMWLGESNQGDGFIHHRYRTGTNGNNGTGNTPGNAVTMGQWNHVVITNDGSQAITYVNGKGITSARLSNLGIDTTALLVGRNLDGGGARNFQGLLDDIAIFDGALTPNQVKALHTKAATPGTVETSVNVAPTGGLRPVVALTFDETSGSVAKDGAGNGYDGMILSNTTHNFVPAVHGNGLQLTGNNNDRVILDAPIALDSDHTIGAWFRDLNPNSSWRTLTRGAQGDHQIIVESGSQRLGIFANGNGNFRPSGLNDMSVYDDDAWHYISAVASGGTTDFYVDGVLLGTSDRQSLFDIISVGNYQGSATGNTFNGGNQQFSQYLDDFAVWNTALTPFQIQLAMSYGALNIPEPSRGLLLLGAAVLGLVQRRRTRS